MSTDFVNKCNPLFVNFDWHKSEKGLGIYT